MQLVDLGSYRDAIQYLELSIGNSNGNIYLKNLSSFWLAEAYYRNGQFQKSIEINQVLIGKDLSFRKTAEYPVALFNLAYGYFKLPDYKKAEEMFKKYLSNHHLHRHMCRKPDLDWEIVFSCRKNYNAAIDIFSEVSQKDNLYTYARYQMSVSYGLIGDDGKKVEVLKEVVNSKVRNRYYPRFFTNWKDTVRRVKQRGCTVFQRVK